MTIKITLKNQENLTATKYFIEDYLKNKKKGTTETVYLSFYLSKDSDKNTSPRPIRLVKMLKEVELTLKSQLSPHIAKNIQAQLDKINIADAC